MSAWGGGCDGVKMYSRCERLCARERREEEAPQKDQERGMKERRGTAGRARGDIGDGDGAPVAFAATNEAPDMRTETNHCHRS